MDLTARHQFGFFHRPLNRMHGGFNIHHYTAFQTPGLMGANANDIDRAIKPISPTRQTTLEVPISSATIMLLVIAIYNSSYLAFWFLDFTEKTTRPFVF